MVIVNNRTTLGATPNVGVARAIAMEYFTVLPELERPRAEQPTTSQRQVAVLGGVGPPALTGQKQTMIR